MMFSCKRSVFRIFCMFFLAIVFSGFAYAQIPEDTPCDECGMKVEPKSKFISYGVTFEGKKLFFCDIGDMLSSLKKKRYKIKDIYVRDYKTGEWIEGQKAYYVRNKKFLTPMEWGIAAFRDLSEAESLGSPVDFNNVLNLLR